MTQGYPVSADVLKANPQLKGVLELNPDYAVSITNNPEKFETDHLGNKAKLPGKNHPEEERQQRIIKITIDHLPYRELSPNSRVHWAVKAKAVKAQRYESAWLGKSQWNNQPPMTRATINYTFVVTNKRRRDLENLHAACKSFVDGLVDAGVLVDDDSKHLEVGHITLKQGDAEQTIIEVEQRLIERLSDATS